MRRIALALAFMLLCMAGCAKPATPVRHPVHFVAFTAKWCEPCHRDRPLVDLLEAHGFRVTRVDIDDCPDMAKSYHITSVPTYLVFDGAHERICRSGSIRVASKAALDTALDAAFDYSGF